MIRLVLLALAALTLLGAPAMAAPEPPHTVVQRDGDFELRDYPALVVADVVVEGDRSAAANRGFRPLAGYIFGDNAPRQKIAMTAPVAQTAEGERIAMTAPVSQAPAGDRRWRVRFYMPEGYTLEALPTPNDATVSLGLQPAARVAVVRFSGGAGERQLAEKEQALRAWIDARALRATGPATYAFYDPPWTPPFWRRNEVMIPIAP